MSKLKKLKRYRQAEPEEWKQRASGQVPSGKPHPKHKSGASFQSWLVPGVICLCLLSLVGFVVKIFLSDDGGHKKALYQVTLIKPPPPDEKVKPPEPEQQKAPPKETITTPVEIPQPQEQNQAPDNAPPAGADLGVAGEGGAGSDAFGLQAKGKNYKGRDITLGGGGGGGGLSRLSLLTKYGGYTQKIQEEIKKRVRATLDQNGGIPQGKFQAVIKITLDAKGSVVKFQIVGTSGNDKMDEALRTTLGTLRMSEPPPEGMPAGMTLRITSQG